MPQCLVIADDLTGANATGVLLSKLGNRSYTVLNLQGSDGSALADFDCVIVPTNSRALDAQTAYDRVRRATAALASPEVRLYSKRIDTTLRGNLGSETDAILDTLADNRVAMVVPCFPDSNRINVGGYLLVNALPLHKTEAASDPKNPMHSSNCADIFRKEAKGELASLFINDLAKGAGHLASRIRELAGAGIRYIIFDAVTQEDVDLVADAVIASGVAFVAVDPGVFTASVARKLVVPRQSGKNARVLAAVGSVNPVAARQAEFFLASQNVLNVYMQVQEFLEGEERREREIARVADGILSQCEQYAVCSVIGLGIKVEYRIGLDDFAKARHCTTDDLSELINDSIADIVQRILRGDKGFAGTYTSGGDITVAVCRRLRTEGLRLFDEVLPLAAYGELVGGEFPGLKFVTKGGMVGDTDAMIACVRYLKERMAL